jgi:hypothetical protein
VTGLARSCPFGSPATAVIPIVAIIAIAAVVTVVPGALVMIAVAGTVGIAPRWRDDAAPEQRDQAEQAAAPGDQSDG